MEKEIKICFTQQPAIDLQNETKNTESEPKSFVCFYKISAASHKAKKDCEGKR